MEKIYSQTISTHTLKKYRLNYLSQVFYPRKKVRYLIDPKVPEMRYSAKKL